MFQQRQEAFDKGSRQTTLDSMPSQEKTDNFMKQFRNNTNNDLSELAASQLLAIWEHYDQDGEELGALVKLATIPTLCLCERAL
jgi:hypothetical protein